MRTTLNLNDDIVTEAKIYAIRHRTTLTAVIEEALRVALKREQATADRAFDLPSVDGGGLPPGFPLKSGSLMGEFVEQAGD